MGILVSRQARRGRLLGRLRQFSGPYRFLRMVKKTAADGLVDTFRWLSPAWTRLGPPKSVFSEYQAVQQKLVPGGVILIEQPTRPLVTSSLRAVAGMRQNDHQPWPIFWSHRRHARLVTASLALLDEQKRLCLEASFMEHSLDGEPGHRFLFLPAPTRLSGAWTSVISRWSPGFHHWFMDALPRLAALRHFPANTRVIVPDPLLPYQAESLRLMGLSDRLRPTPEKHLVVEDYYFSSPTAMTGCWNPYAIDFLRGALLSQGDSSWDSPRKFYIRRVGQARGVANEGAVLSFFEKRGWAIVEMEQLSVAKQISLFQKAEAICGLHGAAFTNLLWCQPGCQVLELCAQNFLNGVYENIAEYLNLNYRYLICPADAAFVAEVDLAKLAKQIDAGNEA